MLIYTTGVDRSIENANEEAEKQKAALEEELSRCCQLVAQAYDRYLIFAASVCRRTEVTVFSRLY